MTGATTSSCIIKWLRLRLRLVFHNRPKLCMMPDYFNGEPVSNESELGTYFHNIKDRP